MNKIHAYWFGRRIDAGINYGIQATTGASLGSLLYDALNDDATDDFGEKAARHHAKCSKILEENPLQPGSGYTGDSYTNHFHKCAQECMKEDDDCK
ncbi:hypothetical protein [Microbulbifer sp. VAAF005]|uniref:hypothetical protein n=1 Tax=Microbulbifer sp. VAAF005 TaxID=3034230 RepID=UPI0024AE1F33|nr:hypothetical protein [Microbulbifer sp. VAAF005]WHI47873.1 hypothetical protein P0078_05635 [Microbulbifer sp. VAAF005]